MIITTKQLMQKYESYKVPKMKIKYEIEKGHYIFLKRGLYETNKEVDPSLLAAYIHNSSYLSFEYALAYYGLIPEKVFNYTSAITGEKHNYAYRNEFGRYSYQNVPMTAFANEVNYKLIGEYSFLIASKEKAICDTLYTKKPVSSVKELKSLLFDSLRIEEEDFKELNLDTLIELSELYKSTNLKYLRKYVEDLKNE